MCPAAPRVSEGARSPRPPSDFRRELESDRLRHRAARLERVLAVLRSHARAYEDASRPRLLVTSLREFEDELGAVRERLRAFERTPPQLSVPGR